MDEMNDFGELKKIPLSDTPLHEANDFTPWLASNIKQLGDALGFELEVIDREVPVGDFYLDLLAKDLGSSGTVIIENQLTQTDHDHLGKLLTYAAGKNASTVIWVSEEVRKEHRRALKWLNQKTDTHFFAVVVEVLKIDSSKPAFDFKPVVFPNEWQKSKQPKISTNPSPKNEKYKAYFQALIDELREHHKFTGARVGLRQNWYDFSSGIQALSYTISYTAWFRQGGKVLAGISIKGSEEKDKNLFDALEKRKTEINSNFGSELEWERRDEQIGSIIGVYHDGVIEASDSELEEIREWHIKNLLKIKEVFAPEIGQALKTIT